MTDRFSCRPLERDEWETFKTIRFEALRTNPDVFSGRIEDEEKRTENDWRDWVHSDRTRCFVLLDGEQVIGCTGIVTDKTDLNGKTALLIASFIRPDYRGRGLSDLLYRARIDYVADHPQWDRIVVSHRAGNEASRRANQHHGFVYTHTKQTTWPDGTTGDDLCYELDVAALRRKKKGATPTTPVLK